MKKADSLREELSKLQIENEVSCLITTHGGGGGEYMIRLTSVFWPPQDKEKSAMLEWWPE